MLMDLCEYKKDLETAFAEITLAFPGPAGVQWRTENSKKLRISSHLSFLLSETLGHIPVHL